MQIITREEAIEKGLRKYFTGYGCKYGHYSERYTLNSNCQECLSLSTLEKRKIILQLREEINEKE